MQIKPLLIITAAAALALPGSALAKGDHGGGGQHGKSGAQRVQKDTSTRGKGRTKARTATFHGTVVSVDGSVVTVHVTQANHRGRAYAGQDVAFDVTGAKRADTVAAGDAVVVQARVTKDAQPPFAARKLQKLDTTEDDASEAPETGDDAPPAS